MSDEMSDDDDFDFLMNDGIRFTPDRPRSAPWLAMTREVLAEIDGPSPLGIEIDGGGFALVRRLGRQRIAVLPLTRDELLRLHDLVAAVWSVLYAESPGTRYSSSTRTKSR